MEISQKDFSELTALVSSMTKTLKNFDDRLNEVEGNVDALGETVTVDLPKAIAEQVGDAVETAIANDAAPVDNEAAVEGEEEVVAEDGGEPCPECGNSPCTCEGGEAQEFCGDSESFEDFSEKVTTTIEDLAHHVNDIAERVNKMFIKVFSEEEVTSTEADVQKVEGALKEAPEDFKTSEDDGGVVKATVVTETVSPAVPPVTPPVANEGTSQFSEKRYDQIKDIFNL